MHLHMEHSAVVRTAVAEDVIGCAIAVHRALGPGLLESTYERCLSYELASREVPFRRQVALPVMYRGTRIDCGYRIDLIVNDELLVEVKSGCPGCLRPFC